MNKFKVKFKNELETNINQNKKNKNIRWNVKKKREEFLLMNLINLINMSK